MGLLGWLGLGQAKQAAAPAPQAPAAPELQSQPYMPQVMGIVKTEEFQRQYGVARLKSAIKASREAMTPFLTARKENARQICGPLGDQGATGAYPVNMLALMYNTYMRYLTPENLKVLVTARSPEITLQAKALEQVINQAIANGDMTSVLTQVIADALMSTGFLKVGYDDKGLPCCVPIMLENMFLDVAAPRLQDMTYIGHRYLVNVDDLAAFAEQNPASFDMDAVNDVMAASKRTGEPNTQGSSFTPGVQDVYYGSMMTVRQQRMERLAWLYDVYIPKHNMVVTIADDSAKIVRVMMLGEGRRCPYKLLTFEDLPGSILSSSPATRLAALNYHIQNTFIQSAQTSRASKTIMLYPKGSQDTAEAINGAISGTAVPVTNPKDFQLFTFPGPSGQDMAYSMNLQEAFNLNAGNLQTLAGLSVSAPTATQEELVNNNSSKMVEFWQKRVYEFCREILKDYAWMIWHEGEVDYPYVEQIPVNGKTLDMPCVFNPGHRAYDFDLVAVDIAPYSQVIRTPQARLSALMSIVNQVILPMAPMLQAQGKIIDFGSIISQITMLADLPEINSIVQDIPPEMLAQMQMQGAQGQASSAPGKPAVTSRTYTRKTEGVGRDKNAAMQQALSSDKPNTAGNAKES